MELKERVGINVDVDWRIIFSANIWKLKEKEPGLQHYQRLVNKNSDNVPTCTTTNCPLSGLCRCVIPTIFAHICVSAKRVN